MGRTEFAETGFTQETDVLGPKHLTHSHLVDAMMYGRQKMQAEIGFQSGSSMPSLWYGLALFQQPYVRNWVLAQWYSTCLTCEGLWAQYPAPPIPQQHLSH